MLYQYVTFFPCNISPHCMLCNEAERVLSYTISFLFILKRGRESPQINTQELSIFISSQEVLCNILLNKIIGPSPRLTTFPWIVPWLIPSWKEYVPQLSPTPGHHQYYIPKELPNCFNQPKCFNPPKKKMNNELTPSKKKMNNLHIQKDEEPSYPHLRIQILPMYLLPFGNSNYFRQSGALPHSGIGKLPIWEDG